jgi:hypothetical protein
LDVSSFNLDRFTAPPYQLIYIMNQKDHVIIDNAPLASVANVIPPIESSAAIIEHDHGSNTTTNVILQSTIATISAQPWLRIYHRLMNTKK